MIKKTNKTLIALFVLMTLVSSLSEAKEASSKPAGKAPKTKKVKVSFTDELVEGSTAKPDVDNINSKKDFNFRKLIRVRDNFMNEMEGGLNDFKAQ